MPEMRAPLTKASLGGKTRFSTKMDSTAFDGELMGRSPLVNQNHNTFGVCTYRPLTDIKQGACIAFASLLPDPTMGKLSTNPNYQITAPALRHGHCPCPCLCRPFDISPAKQNALIIYN